MPCGSVCALGNEKEWANSLKVASKHVSNGVNALETA